MYNSLSMYLHSLKRFEITALFSRFGHILVRKRKPHVAKGIPDTIVGDMCHDNARSTAS